MKISPAPELFYSAEHSAHTAEDPRTAGFLADGVASRRRAAPVSSRATQPAPRVGPVTRLPDARAPPRGACPIPPATQVPQSRPAQGTAAAPSRWAGGRRRAQALASSMSLTSQIEKLAISSRVPVNGLSVTATASGCPSGRNAAISEQIGAASESASPTPLLPVVRGRKTS